VTDQHEVQSKNCVHKVSSMKNISTPPLFHDYTTTQVHCLT